MNNRPSLTVVQYAGDFREAVARLSAGGEEHYRGQSYTVGFIEKLAGTCAVTTIVGFTEEPYDVVLPSGVRAIGAGFKTRFHDKTIVSLIEQTDPDLLILRSPFRGPMRWAMRHRRRTLMLLADSFNKKSLKSYLSRRLLGFMLRSRTFDVVANHGVRAAQQLVDMGVPASKVLAWDYPAFDCPHHWPAKKAPSATQTVLYVGLLIAEKGVDDLIEAVVTLRRRGTRVKLDLVGTGDNERVTALIDKHTIGDQIRLVGVVPNGAIISRMKDADIVAVPSRHEYSEGIPLTIYEAYCSRTPLIVSDHPMFVGNVVNDEAGLVVPAGSASHLADAIQRLLNDQALYARLSERSIAAWERLQISAKWDQVIAAWVTNSDEARLWFKEHAMEESSS